MLDNVFNFVWANDQVVYYTVPNAQLRPYQVRHGLMQLVWVNWHGLHKVYAHVIGTEQSQDVLVYEELDDTVFVDITSSKDGVSSCWIQDAWWIANLAA